MKRMDCLERFLTTLRTADDSAGLRACPMSFEQLKEQTKLHRIYDHPDRDRRGKRFSAIVKFPAVGVSGEVTDGEAIIRSIILKCTEIRAQDLKGNEWSGNPVSEVAGLNIPGQEYH